MIASGLTRVAPNNKTAIALKKAGLVTFMPAFGWLLTPEGNQVHKELVERA